LGNEPIGVVVQVVGMAVVEQAGVWNGKVKV